LAAPGRDGWNIMEHTVRKRDYDLVVMSGSAGGMAAVARVLSELPSTWPIPVLIVLHHAAGHSEILRHILAKSSRLPVTVGQPGVVVRPGVVYLAPADRHMWLDRGGVLVCGDGRRLNYLHSSAEPLLDSVTNWYAPRAVAIILSGSGRNGAAGVRRLHDAGGFVIAQDRATSEHFGMPGAAIEAGGVDQVVPLPEIAPLLKALVEEQASAV
jgi:two-component system, chemotaxis family, protein-glutamate methylesterase/glutaminase